MAPAFSSPRQAGAFALLLLFILALPWLAGKSGLPPRESVYAPASWRLGAYPYLDRQIFHEQGDIDILFIGSSREYFGIDTPYLQNKLSESLGRPAVVRTLCWYWSGFDALYFITRDVLSHRKVHMIVFCDETGGDNPHLYASHWYRYGENKDDLDGLSWKKKAAYYADAILGLPHNLMRLFPSARTVRPFSGEQLELRKPYQAANPADRLGSLAVRRGLDLSHPFAAFVPPAEAKPADVCLYSTVTKDKFAFSRQAFPPVQLHFGQKFAELARQEGTRLVLLNLPTSHELRAATIDSTQFWPDLLHADVAMVGIPPATLFGRLTDDEVLNLYYDPHHFNQNGQQYFTPIITPALIDLYENK